MAESNLPSSLFNEIVKLINNHNASFSHVQGKVSNLQLNNKPWIVDSSASNHMLKNIHNASKIESLSHEKHVTIANDLNVPIKGIGKLNILSSTTEDLYLSNFASNLLSVSKITKDLKCNAIFDPIKVIFQNIQTGRMIYEGRMKDGLYLLEGINKGFRVKRRPRIIENLTCKIRTSF